MFYCESGIITNYFKAVVGIFSMISVFSFERSISTEMRLQQLFAVFIVTNDFSFWCKNIKIGLPLGVNHWVFFHKNFVNINIFILWLVTSGGVQDEKMHCVE